MNLRTGLVLLLAALICGCSSHGNALGELFKPKPKHQDLYYQVDVELAFENSRYVQSFPIKCSTEFIYKGDWDTKWTTTPRIVDAEVQGQDYLVFYTVPCVYLRENNVEQYCPSVISVKASGEVQEFEDARDYSETRREYVKNCHLQASVKGYQQIQKSDFNERIAKLNQTFRTKELKRLEALGQLYYRGALALRY